METTNTTWGLIALGILFGFLFLAFAIYVVLAMRQARMAIAKPEEANKIEKSLIQSRLPYWFIFGLGFLMALVGFDGLRSATATSPDSISPSAMIFYGLLMAFTGILGLYYRKVRLAQIEKGITPRGLPLSRKIIALVALIVIIVGHGSGLQPIILNILTGIGAIIAIAAVFWIGNKSS